MSSAPVYNLDPAAHVKQTVPNSRKNHRDRFPLRSGADHKGQSSQKTSCHRQRSIPVFPVSKESNRHLKGKGTEIIQKEIRIKLSGIRKDSENEKSTAKIHQKM